MKGYEFKKINRDDQYEFCGGLMALTQFIEDLEDNDTLTQYSSKVIVVRRNRKIIGVQIFDETCAFYEYDGNRTVRDIVNSHFEI